MTQEEFLLHYGKKGMKWGVRRRYDNFKSKANVKQLEKKEKAKAKQLEKKEKAKAKQLEKKENEWARTQPDALLKKYAADPTITKEALVKAQKVIGKKKYVSDEEMGRIYTKAVVDAINKRLDAAPDNKSPSGDKRVKVEVVEAFGQTMLKPVVQTKVEKGKTK